MKTIPFWKLWRQYWKDVFVEGHDYQCLFSASGGQAHYDSLFQCKKCRHKIWRRTNNWVEH